MNNEAAEVPTDLVTPTDLGDYEIPGWNGVQMVAATLMSGAGFLGFCALVWILTR